MISNDEYGLESDMAKPIYIVRKIDNANEDLSNSLKIKETWTTEEILRREG
jgi:hypothetical protein